MLLGVVFEELVDVVTGVPDSVLVRPGDHPPGG